MYGLYQRAFLGIPHSGIPCLHTRRVYNEDNELFSRETGYNIINMKT